MGVKAAAERQRDEVNSAKTRVTDEVCGGIFSLSPWRSNCHIMGGSTPHPARTFHAFCLV